MNVLLALGLVAAFFCLLAVMLWDIDRQCDRAQHELDLDELWQDDDLEVAA